MPTTGFTYLRPLTVADLIRDLAEPGAFALAGGTDLVPLRAAGAIIPAVLVDVKHVAELRGVEPEGDAIRIGAATTLADLGERDDRSLDAILDGAKIVGAAQTRERATLGGNLCRSSPAGDTLCGLLVLDAVAELQSLDGIRHVPVRDFFTGPSRNVRKPSEALVSIRVPVREGGSAYRRFTYRRSMDLAVVGVAAWLSIENGVCVDAAIAIGAVAPTPRLVPAAAETLVGTTCDDEAIAHACEHVVAASSPIDDVRGTRDHRLRVLRPLTRDTLLLALTRALGSSPP
ncbi:xanthine dehydrogenase family protein subunit M [Spongiactinospora rosea]|uniref:Xanthine dehydrogenase family protein subunit M n=1 Tax=Spongiactinospora rosea TaxID=2248750 RepID=A0A366LLB1_9ACTN|nr:FAD binding domain-containing protein [Spongiactinospora rosea]RBQ14715.1 xanthine dehydrogenase family protein subunit M [Spongiactinospora rosea]